jgi:uncharacterized OsmC-like protein
LTKTEVHIERLASSDEYLQTRFVIEIALDGDYDQREKVILFNSARKCDVSKMLAGEINFQYQLIEGKFD